MSRVAIIPARGGSKRIPRKNIKNFCGKPIISYAIDAAKRTNLFDHIYVSTEDGEIGAVALANGASVISRPMILSDDQTTTIAVIQHAIKELQTQNIPVEEVCCIYPTTPLLTSEAITIGYQRLQSNPQFYVFPVTMISSPVGKILSLSEENKTKLMDSASYASRSQDLAAGYTDAGQFYWGKRENWLHRENILENGHAIVEGKWKFIDINDIEDWKLAELIYEKRRVLDAARTGL